MNLNTLRALVATADTHPFVVVFGDTGMIGVRRGDEAIELAKAFGAEATVWKRIVHVRKVRGTAVTRTISDKAVSPKKAMASWQRLGGETSVTQSMRGAADVSVARVY